MAAAPWVYLALLRPWQLRWGATPEEAQNRAERSPAQLAAAQEAGLAGEGGR